MQRPACRSKSGILVAVGVTDHDNLPVRSSPEVLSIHIVAKERVQNMLPPLQIIDGFQQLRDVYRNLEVPIVQFAPGGEQPY